MRGTGAVYQWRGGRDAPCGSVARRWQIPYGHCHRLNHSHALLLSFWAQVCLKAENSLSLTRFFLGCPVFRPQGVTIALGLVFAVEVCRSISRLPGDLTNEGNRHHQFNRDRQFDGLRRSEEHTSEL